MVAESAWATIFSRTSLTSLALPRLLVVTSLMLSLLLPGEMERLLKAKALDALST